MSSPKLGSSGLSANDRTFTGNLRRGLLCGGSKSLEIHLWDSGNDKVMKEQRPSSTNLIKKEFMGLRFMIYGSPAQNFVLMIGLFSEKVS